MAITADSMARAEAKRHRISFVDRIRGALSAECSFVGCTRKRHTGPCNVASAAAVAPAAVEIPGSTGRVDNDHTSVPTRVPHAA
jgi:hypothetical protein